MMDIKRRRERLGGRDFMPPEALYELRPADYCAHHGWEVAVDNLEQFMRAIWTEGQGMRLVLGPEVLPRGRDPLDVAQYRTGTARAVALANEIELHLEDGTRVVTKSRYGFTGYVIELDL